MVKPGYQQTEVGIIPKDWDAKPLADITTSVSSGTSDTKSETGDYLLYGSTGVIGSKKGFDYEGKKILVARVGANAGRVNKVDGRYCVSDNTLIVNFVNDVNVDYFFYQLVRRNLNNLVFGSGQPLITGGQLKALYFPSPKEIEEQRAIAKALSDVDELIGSLEKLIAKKRAIKTAAMQQLLTGKKRLPPFDKTHTGYKQTELGEIPEDWDIKELGDFGSFLKGSGVKKDDALSGDIPCIRYGEIYTIHNDHIRVFKSWISQEVASEATRLKKGDLLFAGSGETKEEIGKCVAFLDDIEAYAGGDIVILRAERVNPIFMGYCCNTPAVNVQKASMGQGDAVVHISASALSAIKLAIPPIPEQFAIAELILDMDYEIDSIEERLRKTRQIKQGMMQELLTGRTRLIKHGGNANG